MNDSNAQQNNREYESFSKVVWPLLGAMAFGGIAFYLYGITNYENEKPFFAFSPLQIASIVFSALLGSLISFYYHTGKTQRSLIYLKAIGVLFSLGMIIYGIQGIQQRERDSNSIRSLHWNAGN